MPDNATPLIVLTRPAAQSARFAQACRAAFGAQAEIEVVPLQRIVPLAGVDTDIGAAALIFTSENGVTTWAEATQTRDTPAWCVGDRTAAAAREAGFTARSADGDAAALVALLLVARPGGRLVHLHGRHTRGEVVAQLRAAGLEASGLAIYDQEAAPPPAGFAAMLADRRAIVPLFSPRSATLFAQALGPAPPADLVLPCLSPAVRAALPAALAARASVAEVPTAEAMLDAMTRHISP